VTGENRLHKITLFLNIHSLSKIPGNDMVFLDMASLKENPACNTYMYWKVPTSENDKIQMAPQVFE
jgi:hypothetical protein